MRIAIPLAGGQLALHFGHCEQFALVDVDDATRAIGVTALHEPPAHEPGALPQWLAEQGADLVIVGGMGRRAQQLLAANGIDVIVGANAAEPRDLVQAYLDGTLTGGENVCDH
jgi:predicted Fe-Mo cluster-binding NifX family protein